TWNFHGDIRYGWQAWEIGLSLTVVGIGSALVQGGLTGWLIKRIGAVRTALFGYVINVVSFTAFAFAGLGWIAYLVIPISALGGVVGPAVNTIMSNVTPKNAQGELHGASASIQALAMIISPVVMTQTLHHFSKETAPIYFPGAAFLLAAGITALALLPFLAGVRANEDGLVPEAAKSET
ncbi:MAG: MFS transporter, partial [Pseudomonadota bacterium]